MRATRLILTTACVALLTACSGGGGSSSSTQAAPDTTGTAGGGGSDGGATGGDGSSTGGGSTTGGGSGGSEGGSGIGVGFSGGISGTGLNLGALQALSSVVVNDRVMNTDDAVFIVEGETSSQAALTVGQRLDVIGDLDALEAAEVRYRANVKGPLTSLTNVDAELGTANGVVLGQRFVTDATTLFSDVTLEGLQTGDLLEVSGFIDSTGRLVASFVELKTTLDEYKVIGTVAALTSSTFDLDQLQVDYASATLDDFDGQPIANGDFVEVKGAPGDFTSPDQLTATRVELLPVLTVTGDVRAEIEGFITRFGSATDFDVATTNVTTTSSTEYVNGTADSLGANVKVEAEGTLGSDGTLTATRIVIKPTNAIRAEGPATAIDASTREISMLGITFLMRDLTEFDDSSSADVDPLTLNDIGSGDYLEVRGYLDGTTLVASRIRREDPRDRARLRGPVTDEDAAAGAVTILSVTVTGQSGITQFEDINENVITQSQFHDLVEIGTFVKADWDVFSDTNQTADELSIED